MFTKKTTDLQSIDAELDMLSARLDEAKVDLKAAHKNVETLQQTKKAIMARAVDDPVAAKEALKIEDEIASAQRMAAISGDVLDQIRSRIGAKKIECRQLELAAQETHRIHWESVQEASVEAAIRAMTPHIVDAVKAGYARGMNVSQKLAHEVQVAINKICSPHNENINRRAIVPPESRHLDENDRSPVSSRPRDPIAIQAEIDDRLVREQQVKEQNKARGESSRRYLHD